jgi:DnaJ-domain-containing protein 1
VVAAESRANTLQTTSGNATSLELTSLRDQLEAASNARKASSFELAGVKAELEASQTANQTLRDRLQVLGQDVEAMKAELKAALAGSRGSAALSDQVERLQRELLQEKARVRELGSQLETVKVRTVGAG